MKELLKIRKNLPSNVNIHNCTVQCILTWLKTNALWSPGTRRQAASGPGCWGAASPSWPRRRSRPRSRDTSGRTPGCSAGRSGTGECRKMQTPNISNKTLLKSVKYLMLLFPGWSRRTFVIRAQCPASPPYRGCSEAATRRRSRNQVGLHSFNNVANRLNILSILRTQRLRCGV